VSDKDVDVLKETLGVKKPPPRVKGEVVHITEAEMQLVSCNRCNLRPVTAASVTTYELPGGAKLRLCLLCANRWDVFCRTRVEYETFVVARSTLEWAIHNSPSRHDIPAYHKALRDAEAAMDDIVHRWLAGDFEVKVPRAGLPSDADPPVDRR
jgi:hypothetical protein